MANELSMMRADVIEKSINIEWIMNFIIAQHYLGRPTTPFLFEFLYNEYFTFALRRSVLFAICPELEAERCENNHSFGSNLGRANKIRNYFAHCGQRVTAASDPNALPRVPDPRDFEKMIAFADLYKDFCKLEKPITKRLGAIFEEKGGIAIPKPAPNLIKD